MSRPESRTIIVLTSFHQEFITGQYNHQSNHWRNNPASKSRTFCSTSDWASNHRPTVPSTFSLQAPSLINHFLISITGSWASHHWKTLLPEFSANQPSQLRHFKLPDTRNLLLSCHTHPLIHKDCQGLNGETIGTLSTEFLLLTCDYLALFLLVVLMGACSKLTS